MTRSRAPLAFLLVAAAAGLVVIGSRPASYRVEGSILLPGPPATTATALAELQQWAPWGTRPDVHHTYGGTWGKPGSSCYWSGGPGVGKGRLTLLSSGPQQLDLEVEVEDGGRHEGDLTLRLSDEGESTRVSWSLAGERTRWLAWMDRIPAPMERLQARLEPALAGLEDAAEEALQRDHRVERSVRVAASPAEVVHQLADLRHWTAWIPGERLDPSMSRTYGGPPAGKGQSYYWAGNDAVGRGRLTIVGVEGDRIAVEREVERPRHSESDLEVRVQPEGDGARITWTVLGAPPVVPAMRGDPDSALGREIEEALALLKVAVETATLGHARR